LPFRDLPAPILNLSYSFSSLSTHFQHLLLVPTCLRILSTPSNFYCMFSSTSSLFWDLPPIFNLSHPFLSAFTYFQHLLLFLMRLRILSTLSNSYYVFFGHHLVFLGPAAHFRPCTFIFECFFTYFQHLWLVLMRLRTLSTLLNFYNVFSSTTSRFWDLPPIFNLSHSFSSVFTYFQHLQLVLTCSRTLSALLNFYNVFYSITSRFWDLPPIFNLSHSFSSFFTYFQHILLVLMRLRIPSTPFELLQCVL
jgi:hypothetical protein